MQTKWFLLYVWKLKMTEVKVLSWSFIQTCALTIVTTSNFGELYHVKNTFKLNSTSWKKLPLCALFTVVSWAFNHHQHLISAAKKSSPSINSKILHFINKYKSYVKIFPPNYYSVCWFSTWTFTYTTFRRTIEWKVICMKCARKRKLRSFRKDTSKE